MSCCEPCLRRAGQLPAAPSSTNLSVRIRARPPQLETQRTGSAPLAGSPAAGSAALPDGYMEDHAAGAGDYTDGDVDDADDAYDDRGADLAPPPATGSAERAQRACATDPGAHMAAPNPVKSVRNLRLVPWSPQNQTLTAPDPSHAGTTLTWLLSLLSPLKTSAS